VGTARAVLNAKSFDVVTELSQRGGGGGARKACSHHDDLEFPFVRRVDQLEFEAVPVPFPHKGASGHLESNFIKGPPFYKDKKRKTGIEAKPMPMMRLKMIPTRSTKACTWGG